MTTDLTMWNLIDEHMTALRKQWDHKRFVQVKQMLQYMDDYNKRSKQ